MCGITGYLSAADVTQADIARMNDALRHRGPDGDGVLVKDAVGFGHRRLSIIDLAAGQQPMTNADGSLWITFNGEIYNYRELRKGLEPKYQFRTNSDTEVILHLYAERGEDCLRDLRGMFAFAIYDFRSRKLFAARDHLGQKPFYYFHDGADFAFASEIKALLALKPELREMDPQALYEYLTLRVITPPRSMFRRVRKLPPAHRLVFQDGRLSIERYWDLDYRAKRTTDFAGLVEELDHQVTEAVGYHLVSDVPVGAFLSGGMDSSLVVAMMRKLSGDKIKTFSGDVPYRNYSELPYARLAAQKFGTEAHELTIIPSLVRTLPEVAWHLDEPSDPLSTCMYYIAELARSEVKVVLGGDGGDELFGGYDRYYGNVYVSYYALLPEWLRRRVFGPLLKRIPEGYWYRSRSHKLRWMHQMSFAHGGARYAKSLGYFYFSDDYRGALYTDKFRAAVGLFDPEANIGEYFDGAKATEIVDRMLYTDSMTRMPDHPVMILDRMSMAHGLEARSPFMDHRLAEFCATIPPRHKVRGKQLRYVQAALARKYLPPELLNRKKQGFSSPLPYLLDHEFRLLYRGLLKGSRLVADGYLHQAAIDKLLAEHLGKQIDHGQRLWLLCNSEIWYRMYIDGQGREAVRELIQAQAQPN